MADSDTAYSDSGGVASPHPVGMLPQGLHGLSDILNVPEVHLGLISVAE